MITRVDHISIQTENFEKALEFYRILLGFNIVINPYDFKDRKLCYLDAKTIKIELYSIKSGSCSNSRYSTNRLGLDHIAFATENLTDLIERLSSQGVRIIKPPFSLTTAAGRSLLAFVEGPDGQEIELRQEEEVSPK
jgi:catechol 2,3-dioxygenase-like lactoylglutathione lyase family enzyme